jgi:hypothetical protein
MKPTNNQLAIIELLANELISWGNSTKFIHPVHDKLIRDTCNKLADLNLMQPKFAMQIEANLLKISELIKKSKYNQIQIKENVYGEAQ